MHHRRELCAEPAASTVTPLTVVCDGDANVAPVTENAEV